MSKNVSFMLDLETLGLQDTLPAPVVVQIACIAFNPQTGEELGHFNSFIDPEDSARHGCNVEESTKKWWDDLPEATKSRVLGRAAQQGSPLTEVLEAFSKFVQGYRKTDDVSFQMWGNGSVFDNGILSLLYKLVGKERPWKYNEDVDLRTLVFTTKLLTGGDPREGIAFEGIQHDGLYDCKHQIKILMACLKKLRSSSNSEG